MSKKKTKDQARGEETLKNGKEKKSGGKRQAKPPVKCVVHVARECEGLAGAGGIKDVVAGLSRATALAGIDTHLVLPYYRVIEENASLKKTFTESCGFNVRMDYSGLKRTESVTVFSGRLQKKLTVHLIHSQRYRYLFEGSGDIPRNGVYQYTEEEALALGRPSLKGEGYLDFFALNVLLVKSALLALERLEIRPDIIHCHDGHASLLPFIARASAEGYAAYLSHVPTVVTIHNAGRGYHQEVGDLSHVKAICGVDRKTDERSVEGCLLDGDFDPLVAGALYGSVINAVSENYAHEIQHTGEDARTGWLGHHLASLGVTIHGVTNGVDVETCDTTRPENLGLAAGFSVLDGEYDGKETCKKTLLQTLARGQGPAGIKLFGRVDHTPGVPLLTFVGRLDDQKGYDTLAECLAQLFKTDPNVQLLGLGDGSREIALQFQKLAKTYPGRACLAQGYNKGLANQIYAAGDFTLIPSRFEPCGLTDYFAQLMGSVPIVHRVGGLVKTLDRKYGYSYLGGAPELLKTIERALAAYRQPNQTTLRRIQRAAVRNIHKHFTWEKVLKNKYLSLYQEAISSGDPVLPY